MEVVFVFLGIGMMVSLIQWSKQGFPGLVHKEGGARRIPVAYRMDPEQRKAALEAYKHAVSEKMDVLRQAIAMGWGDQELKALDERLEQLIGRDELKRLLDGELHTNVRSAEDMSPVEEIGRLRTAVRQ